MRGRLLWQHLSFFLEGLFIVIFSRAQSLGGSVAALMAFSIFVQIAEGSTFGIVPYLNPSLTGTVAGLIGAGGNAGGVVFSTVFRQTDYRTAFFYMGLATSAISLLSNFIWIKGYHGLFFKRRLDQPSLS
jgi:NNP family nitrate/nitrite transporter-like MFS transporter